MVPTHGWMVRWRSQTTIAAIELVRYIPTWWLGGEHQGCHIGNETREHILEDTFGRLINVLLALLQTHGCWWRRVTKGIASNTTGLLGVDWEHIYIISIEEVGGGGMIMDGPSLRVLKLGTLHFLLWNLFRMCHLGRWKSTPFFVQQLQAFHPAAHWFFLLPLLVSSKAFLGIIETLRHGENPGTCGGLRHCWQLSYRKGGLVVWLPVLAWIGQSRPKGAKESMKMRIFEKVYAHMGNEVHQFR